jgi:hypothetical protein
VETNVDIDIKPGIDPNSINTRSRGVVPVAILGNDIDVSDIDVSTLRFGPCGSKSAEPALGGHTEDVNGYGVMDLVVHFPTQDAGLSSGDTEACIVGETRLAGPSRAAMQ